MVFFLLEKYPSLKPLTQRSIAKA